MEFKDYSVRELIQKDLVECAEIFAATFSATPWNEEWNVSDALLRLSHIYSSLDCVGIVVSDSDGRIVGFVLGNVEPFTHFRLYYLKEMCVLSGVQRHGIGSCMLNYLDRLLIEKGVREVFLATNHGSPAGEFYTKNGYSLVSNMRFYNRLVSS